MRLLSLFSGVGCLDAAVEAAFGATVVAHCEADPFCRKVLARHWPGVPCFADVRALTAADVGPVDVICGGFPCVDLSTAGKQAGLQAARSGLWFEYLRLVGELRPGMVVIENVPPLYRKLAWRKQVQEPLEALGYRVIWTLCKASDVGAPHRRERTFALAVLPGVQVPQVQVPGVKVPGRCYPTPIAGDSKSTGNGNCLTLTDVVVRGKEWPTPAAMLPNDGEGVATFRVRQAKLKAKHSNGNGCGTPLAIAVQDDGDLWPTPTSSDQNGAGRSPRAQGGMDLGEAVTASSTPTAADARDAPDDGRLWATPSASDAKDSEPEGSASYAHMLDRGYLAAQAKIGTASLNPDWVDALMGLPIGHTKPGGEPMRPDFAPLWPAGRGQPQHDWEPPRVVAHKSCPHRRARLKALGNAVVPQQAMLALTRLAATANDSRRCAMGKAQGVLAW